MSTNWKSLVENQNARSYVLPPGWDSREKIAEALGCVEDRVRLQLAPAIKSGVVEMDQFTIWDEKLKRLIRVTAYRKVPANKTSLPAGSRHPAGKSK